jgi:hypothetical protein
MFSVFVGKFWKNSLADFGVFFWPFADEVRV